MRYAILILFILLAAFACEKENITNTTAKKLTKGNYSGTFCRDDGYNEPVVASVNLSFSEDQWSGSGEFPKYPALCHGTYSIDGDNIVFTNECAWTAEFDWSLILSGNYGLKISGDSIEFSRLNGFDNFASVDRYKLKKVED